MPVKRRRSTKDKKTIQKDTRPFFEPTVQDDNGARALMWTGVVIFVLAIVFLWGWSFKIKLDNLSLKTSPEINLANRAQEEWQTNFANEQPKKQEDQMGSLKQVLNTVVSAWREAAKNSTNTASTTATSTATSTLETATTTVSSTLSAIISSSATTTLTTAIATSTASSNTPTTTPTSTTSTLK